MKDIATIKRLWKQWIKAVGSHDRSLSITYSDALKEHGVKTFRDYKIATNTLDNHGNT